MVRPNDWVVIIGNHEHMCQTQGHPSERFPTETTKYFSDDEIQLKINRLMHKSSDGQYNPNYGARTFVDPTSKSSDSHGCSHFSSKTEALKCVNDTIGRKIGAVFKEKKEYPAKNGTPLFIVAEYKDMGIKIGCLYHSYWIVILGGKVPTDSNKKRPADSTKNDGTSNKKLKTETANLAVHSEDDGDDDDDDYSLHGDQKTISVRSGRKRPPRHQTLSPSTRSKDGSKSHPRLNSVGKPCSHETVSTSTSFRDQIVNSVTESLKTSIESPIRRSRETEQSTSLPRPVKDNDKSTPVSSIMNWIMSEVFKGLPVSIAESYARAFVNEAFYSPDMIIDYFSEDMFEKNSPLDAILDNHKKWFMTFLLKERERRHGN